MLCCSSRLSNWWAALPVFWEGKELNLHKGSGMRWYPKTQKTCTSTSTGGAALVCKGVLSHTAAGSVPKWKLAMHGPIGVAWGQEEEMMSVTS